MARIGYKPDPKVRSGKISKESQRSGKTDNVKLKIENFEKRVATGQGVKRRHKTAVSTS